MVNTTETYWSVDGVSLQTYAMNIKTLGGDRLAPPPLRGDDITVPYAAGTVWVPKVVDARTITLGMWILGAEDDGTAPLGSDARRKFDANWRALVKLLWKPRQQFTLTKRFWVPSAELVAGGMSLSGLPTIAGWTLIEAQAKASFAGGLSPTMTGPTRADFTVDLLLSDPYFYSAPITVDFSTSTLPEDPGPVRAINVLGDARTTAINFELDGPLTTARFTQPQITNAPWIQYGSVVADGDTASISVSDFSAVHVDSLATYKSSGYVQHFGDRAWFFLDPGPTTVRLSVQEGTGAATLSYRPVWL